MIFGGLLSACSSTQKITNSARTATEQLLITEAVSRSLPLQRDISFPIPRGATVKLDVAGLTADKDIVKPLHKRIEGRYEKILLKTRVTDVKAGDDGLTAQK